jgi:phytoene dehydrogenase-like protein
MGRDPDGDGTSTRRELIGYGGTLLGTGLLAGCTGGGDGTDSDEGDPTAPPSTDPESPVDHDVAVVGGGVAGLSAAAFTARYGLGTAVFDGGKSAIAQCAHVENYLGVPGGIGPGRLVELGRTQAAREGATVVDERVTAVRRREDGGFDVGTTGREAVADRVVVAAAYDGEGWDDHVDDWFETEMLPGDHDADDATVEAAREDLKAEFLGRCVDAEERRRRDREGQRLLLEALDDDVIREYAGGITDNDDGE